MLQPTPPHMVDDSDDVTFFAAHPGIDCRLRLPFQNEFADDVVSALGRDAMIRVVVARGTMTIWRNVVFVDGWGEA